MLRRRLCHSRLRGSNVKVGAVVGFPLGATLTSVKRFEAAEAMKLGAREIDMVMNIGELKAGNREAVSADIQAVAEFVHAEGALLKVILETHLLTDEEKLLACEISEKAGADFVKTSTGFLGGVATVEDVRLMRRAVTIGVKASGGIRTASDALAMIEAGADSPRHQQRSEYHPRAARQAGALTTARKRLKPARTPTVSSLCPP